MAAVSKRCMSKCNLQSLTGLLQHATKVVRPGRPFLHRLYALQNIGSLPTYHIHWNQAARADITWWFLFVERWNGLSIAWDLHKEMLSRYHSVLRCIWLMGLWGLLSQPLVSAEVASTGGAPAHCHKGVVPSSNFSSSIWEIMVWPLGRVQS